MNGDDIGTALKEAAERWDTPTFDPLALAAMSTTRRHRARRRALGSFLALAAIAGAVTVVVLTGGQGAPGANTGSVAPGRLPDGRITVLTTTGHKLNGQPVLARAPTGRSITIRALLSFVFSPPRPARVDAAALIVAQPGTQAGAGGPAYDSFYDTTRIAEGQPVSANAPHRRVLSVTTPANLPPGTYPVFTALRTALMPGQDGLYGPYNVSSQLGVIIVTPH